MSNPTDAERQVARELAGKCTWGRSSELKCRCYTLITFADAWESPKCELARKIATVLAAARAAGERTGIEQCRKAAAKVVRGYETVCRRSFDNPDATMWPDWCDEIAGWVEAIGTADDDFSDLSSENTETSTDE